MTWQLYLIFAAGLLGMFSFADACAKAWHYYWSVKRKHRF